MSVDVSAFFDPNRGDAAKFEVFGDSVSGTIVDAELIDDQNNIGKQVLVIKISDADAIKSLYARPPGMKDAIGQAVLDAGVNAVEPGGHLTVTYTGDKPLRSGKAMKLYSAEYKPPAD